MPVPSTAGKTEQEYVSDFMSQMKDDYPDAKQRAAVAYQTYRDKVKKAETVQGYESPEPGDISDHDKQILAHAYASCRKDGGDKTKCAKIAWAAVHNAKKALKANVNKALLSIGHVMKDMVFQVANSDDDAESFAVGNPLPANFNPRIKLFGMLGAIKIYEVYVKAIQDAHVWDDFTEGGNGYRYNFQPKNEIWIDSEVDTGRKIKIIFHELIESGLMKAGMSYEKAHGIASKYEDDLEDNPQTKAEFEGLIKKPEAGVGGTV